MTQGGVQRQRLSTLSVSQFSKQENIQVGWGAGPG